MKKNWFIISILMLFCILQISCFLKKLPDVTGEWNATLSLKSELGAPDEEAAAAYLFTEQRISYHFSDDGYTQTVVQTVQDVTEVQDDTAEKAPEEKEALKAYFAHYFDKTLVFTGVYRQTPKALVLQVETVQENGSDVLSYYDFYAKDNSIGGEVQTLSYALTGDELVLNGTTYWRAQ